MTNKEEIEKVFRGNFRQMFGLANRMLHDEDAARDVVHDVFASLLESRLSAVNTSFLLRAVRYACLKHIRSLSVRERFVMAYSLDCETTESESWPSDEDVARLNDVIDRKLSPRTREVLRLKYVGLLKYREIAERLSISEVAVYRHLHQAISVLRQNFNKNER